MDSSDSEEEYTTLPAKRYTKPKKPRLDESNKGTTAVPDVRVTFIEEMFGTLPAHINRQIMKDLSCLTPGCPGTITKHVHYCRRCADQQRRYANREKSCLTPGCKRTVAFSGYCRACNNERPKREAPKRSRSSLRVIDKMDVEDATLKPPHLLQ